MLKRFLIIAVLLSLCTITYAENINRCLQKIHNSVKALENLSAEIEYIHIQKIFETKSIKTGKLFYKKTDEKSALRINFLTSQQDDGKKEKFKEDYIFDGFKLTRLDHQSKTSNTEIISQDRAVEPFELVQNYFPIVGFAEPNELAADFDITTLDCEKDKDTKFKFKMLPKKDSGYAKIYTQVILKVSPANMPFEFSAETNNNEQIIIRFSKLNTKSKIKDAVFSPEF